MAPRPLAHRPAGNSRLAANDRRRSNPRFVGENFERNRELADRMAALARERAVTAAQLALAWILAQGADVVPIPGTTRVVDRLDENLAASEIRLSRADLERLDEIAPLGAAAGDRYPETMARWIDT